MFFVCGVLVYGEHLCKILTIILVTSVPSSVWALLPISIECLKNLSDPLNHLRRSPFLTSKRALIAIIFIWLYNVLSFAAVPSIFLRDAPDESLIFKEVCWFPQSRAYALIPVILNFILPLIITSGIYIKTYLIAHQRKRTELVGDS